GAGQDSEDQRPDVFRRGGLEQGPAARRAIANVVPDEVRDDRRVARVVFRDARFDLAHEIGADVRGFRVDPSAELREQRDQAGTEPKPDDREDELPLVAFDWGNPRSVPVVQDSHAGEGAGNDSEAGAGSAPEGTDQRSIE